MGTLIHIIFSMFLLISTFGTLGSLMMHKKTKDRYYIVTTMICLVVFFHTLYWYVRYTM